MTESPANQDYRSLLQDAVLKIRQLKSRIGELERGKSEAIAIIGLGCRFPGGINGPLDYWRLLQSGQDVISEVPADRWNVEDYFHPDPGTPGKICSRHGCFLNDLAEFDASFFGIPSDEAVTMDPQHRVLLEVGWEALEDAGQSPDRLYGGPVGVFVGISNNDYSQLLSKQPVCQIDSHLGTGISHSTSAGRISHLLGLRGPSMAIDTACSSSLVATHLACQSLRSGECDLALACGVNVLLRPELSIYFSQAGLLSTDGRCKAFAASANGVVRGEGCGVVVLKRLSDAQADRDNILTVIRGSSVNHDGPSGGLTVPNGPAQQTLIRSALASGGVDPMDVSVIEAHGAGTLLGDSIEIGALAAVYCQGRPRDEPLIVASHKTNLGHLESAGGIAGLIKMVLALRHAEIAPHLNLDQLNPKVPWDNLPIHVPTQRMSWARAEKPRVAAVSSFSFSGTNAHVVVEEAPAQTAEPLGSDGSPHVLTISAKCLTALRELARRYVKQLGGSASFGDVCYTANNGRSHFEHRLAVVADSGQDAAAKLDAYLEGQMQDGVFHGMAMQDAPFDGSIPTASVESGARPDADSQSSPPGTVDVATPASLAEQYVQGGLVDWESLAQDRPHRTVPLPTYPFQRQRFWVEESERSENDVLST